MQTHEIYFELKSCSAWRVLPTGSHAISYRSSTLTWRYMSRTIEQNPEQSRPAAADCKGTSQVLTPDYDTDLMNHMVFFEYLGYCVDPQVTTRLDLAAATLITWLDSNPRRESPTSSMTGVHVRMHVRFDLLLSSVEKVNSGPSVPPSWSHWTTFRCRMEGTSGTFVWWRFFTQS